MSSEDSCISASPITGKRAKLHLSVQVKAENEQHYAEIELSPTNSKNMKPKSEDGAKYKVGPLYWPQPQTM